MSLVRKYFRISRGIMPKKRQKKITKKMHLSSGQTGFFGTFLKLKLDCMHVSRSEQRCGMHAQSLGGIRLLEVGEKVVFHLSNVG